MSIQMLKMFLEEMQDHLEYLNILSDNIERGKLTSKDNKTVERQVFNDIFTIKDDANIILKYLDDIVSNLQ